MHVREKTQNGLNPEIKEVLQKKMKTFIRMQRREYLDAAYELLNEQNMKVKQESSLDRQIENLVKHQRK